MSTQPKLRVAASLLALAVAWPSVALAVGPSSNRAYLGKPVDPGFGFQDLQHRWYDPSAQRFLSLDPVFWEVGRVPQQPGGKPSDWQRALRSSQAQNPTGYASGNPVRYSDPEGRYATPDTAWDLGWVAYDVYQLSRASAPLERAERSAALAADLAALAVPGLPAVGGLAKLTGRAVSKADDAAKALVKVGDGAADAAKAATVSTSIQLTVGELIKGAKFEARKGKAVIYGKSGGFDQAVQDFEQMVGGSMVTVQANGVRTATINGNVKVNVRPKSSDGRPTLEIIPPQGKRTKVRYGS